MRKFGAVTLTGGLNGEFWSNNYVEDGRSVSDFMLTPSFSVAWNINQASSLRLNYSAYSTLPSLTETSDVVQTIDAFQIQKGNPDLKPYTTYDIGVRYSFSIPRLSGSVYGSWSRLPGAIMEYCSFAPDGKIVNSWENAVGATRYKAGVAPRITIVPNFLTINGTVEFRHFRNHGPNYRLVSNSICAELSARATYRNFSCGLYYVKSAKNLYGQTITRYEDFNMIDVAYRYKHFTFKANLLHPIGRYRGQENEKQSKIAWSKNGLYANIERTVTLGVSFDLNWGRKKDMVNRRANAATEFDRVNAASK